MGYRSEVAIKMSRESYNKMLECIEKLEKGKLDEFTKTLNFDGYPSVERVAQNVKELLELDEDEGVIRMDDEFVTLHFDYVKWYGSYLDVKIIEHFMRLDDNYDFLRIGEDVEDIEEDFHTDTYPFSVLRSIDFCE